MVDSAVYLGAHRETAENELKVFSIHVYANSTQIIPIYEYKVMPYKLLELEGLVCWASYRMGSSFKQYKSSMQTFYSDILIQPMV